MYLVSVTRLNISKNNLGIYQKPDNARSPEWSSSNQDIFRHKRT